MAAHKNLLSTFEIGSLTLKNRVALAPMTRARGGAKCLPNELMTKYYVQRASAGVLISEGTFVSKWAQGWVNVPFISSPEFVEAWKPVTKAVHDANGVIFCQLWHCGRASHSSFHGKPPAAADAIIGEKEVHTNHYDKREAEVPHRLTIEELVETKNDFAQAAKYAIEAGFDGVEIHGANGYLLDGFMQSCSNQRDDAYGGSIENRAKFPLEVLDAVIEAVGDKKRVAYRISPNGVFGSMGSDDFREQFTYAAEQIGKRDIGFLHVVDGLAFGFHNKGEPVTLAEIRKVLPETVAIMGNCGYTPDTAEERIAAGDADLISFGRPYLANPDLVERIEKGAPLAEVPHHSTFFSPKTADDYATEEGYIYPTIVASS